MRLRFPREGLTPVPPEQDDRDRASVGEGCNVDPYSEQIFDHLSRAKDTVRCLEGKPEDECPHDHSQEVRALVSTDSRFLP